MKADTVVRGTHKLWVLPIKPNRANSVEAIKKISFILKIDKAVLTKKEFYSKSDLRCVMC